MSGQTLYLSYDPDPATDVHVQTLRGKLANAGFTLHPTLQTLSDVVNADAILIFLLHDNGDDPFAQELIQAARDARKRILCITTLDIATRRKIATLQGVVPVLLLDDDWDKLWEKLLSRLTGQLSGQFPPAVPHQPRPKTEDPDPEIAFRSPRYSPPPLEPPASHELDYADDDLDIPNFLRSGRPRPVSGPVRRPHPLPERKRDIPDPLPPAVPSPAPEPELETAADTPRMEESAKERIPSSSVLFSANYPKEVAPEDWQPLYAYILKETAMNAVEVDIRRQFGDRADIRSTTRPAQQEVAEGALVTATPHLPGFEFDPPSLSARFRKAWRRFDFEFQAMDAPPDTATNGRITFTVEGVIVADVPVSIFVGSGDVSATHRVSTVKPYSAIFCSYSHRDTAIVERVEAAYKALGHEFLRDVTTLRSGQDWNAELLNMIDRADIFQLFWSANAAESPYVEQEWRHALALMAQQAKDAYFIRPVCWEETMPPPPDELGRIHFAYQPELGA